MCDPSQLLSEISFWDGFRLLSAITDKALTWTTVYGVRYANVRFSLVDLLNFNPVVGRWLSLDVNFAAVTVFLERNLRLWFDERNLKGSESTHVAELGVEQTKREAVLQSQRLNKVVNDLLVKTEHLSKWAL